jgi:dTDP-4-dehydrorhamnose 3,5-epimerase-like enzyme
MTFDDKPFLFEISKIGSPSIGYISIAENSNLPFQVQRVYWTYFTPDDVMRGNHAHKELQQVIFAVAGQITINTIDRKDNQESFMLTKPNIGLYIPSLCWRTLQFSHNAVLMCLASKEFAEEDYVRDFSQFITLIEK